MLRSVQTNDMSNEDLTSYKEMIKAMTPEELDAFRNSFDADMMGFSGKEAVDEFTDQ